MWSDELFRPAPDAQAAVLTVSELTEQLKSLLETSFSSVWVAGEISNFSRPQSGHCYLTLKDDQAQLRAVMWRGTASRVRFDVHDGLEVICQGHIDLYAPRGSYQLVIEQIQPKGLGTLELALRQLRQRLAAEGLFDPARKRPLPRFPRRIAFVTSPTGAAIHDFLQVLLRRWRSVDVLVVPVRVQGEGSAAEIVAAIAQVNRMSTPIDVLVVGRGGGSLEDLWAFNEEAVIRAIVASRIPVVSAVGHEIDVTLSDLAADVRALTPSEAAERIVPASEELRATLETHQRRLRTVMRARVVTARERLENINARPVIRRPLDWLFDRSRRADELAQRAARAVRERLSQARSRADSLAGRINSLSPLAVLGRGFSLTSRVSDGRTVSDAASLGIGERISTRFATGPRDQPRRGGATVSESSVPDGLSFEQSLEKLEAIVHRLEDGQIGLTEALAQYEEGVKLLKQCYSLLQGAEQRIELLSGIDAQGKPTTEPFDAQDSVSRQEKGPKTSRRRSVSGGGKPPAKLPADDPNDVDSGEGLF